MDLLILQLVVLIYPLLVLFTFTAVAINESRLDRLCAHIVRGQFSRSPSIWKVFTPLRTYSFDGEFMRRPMRLRMAYKANGYDSNAELEIQFPVIQKFWLRLLRQSSAATAEDDIRIIDELFDSAYLIHSNQPEAAKTFLSDAQTRSRFAECAGFTKFEIHQGSIKLIYANLAQDLPNNELQPVLLALLRIVEAYEAQATLKILPLTADSNLCSYCRDSIAHPGETVVRCHSCGTALHSECFQQNGICTTWGCGSSDFRPARAEPRPPPFKSEI